MALAIMVIGQRSGGVGARRGTYRRSTAEPSCACLSELRSLHYGYSLLGHGEGGFAVDASTLPAVATSGEAGPHDSEWKSAGRDANSYRMNETGLAVFDRLGRVWAELNSNVTPSSEERHMTCRIDRCV
jgi:hypothetical protein